MEAASKFAIAVVPGKRTVGSVRNLIGALGKRTDHRLPRLITRDEYKPYRRVLLEVYGVVHLRQRRSPAMAESLTDRIWSVRDLCCRQASPP